MKENRPKLAIYMQKPDFGLAEAYTNFFSERGYTCVKGEINSPAILADLSITDFLICDFRLLGDSADIVQKIPADKTIIDYHHDPAGSDMGHNPWHLFDSVTVIVHDEEARSFIQTEIKPLNCNVVLFPYPAPPAVDGRSRGEKTIYTPEKLKNHKWLAQTDVTILGEPYDCVAHPDSVLVITEYHPEIWRAIRWAATNKIGVVAPGTESLMPALFHGAIFFDPDSEEDFRLKLLMFSRPEVEVNSSKKIGVVVPLHKQNAPGGAENAAVGIARSFASSGYESEILTTCTDSMIDWNNNLTQGAGDENGLFVRRFPIDSTSPKNHHKIGHKINLREKLTFSEQIKWMGDSIRSTKLDEYVAEKAEDYQALICLPYLYGTTYWTSQRAPERSFLVPCYHDEAPAHTAVLRQNAAWVAGSFFNTFAEKKLAEGPLSTLSRGIVAGLGVDMDQKGDGDRFRKKYNIEGDFLLYIGRLQREKNVPELLDYYSAFAKQRDNKALMVMAGSGDVKVNDNTSTGLRYLGFIDEQDKIDAYNACTAFVLPSIQESFSIVMMEAWLAGKPVLAHGRCNVSREHIFACGGGLLYNTKDEFIENAGRLFTKKSLCKEMGESGQRYVRKNFVWEKVVKRMIQVIEASPDNPSLSARLGSTLSKYVKNYFRNETAELDDWLERGRKPKDDVLTTVEKSLCDMVDELNCAHDKPVKYKEFSNRAFIGFLYSKIRDNMTRHLRTNYIEIMESRQNSQNKKMAAIIEKIIRLLGR